MNELLLLDSSCDEVSGAEDVFVINYDLSQAENAHIQININRLEIGLLCDALDEGILRYKDQRKKMTRRRMQDVNAIRNIIANSQQYKTKEECMIIVQQRLEQFRTGWLIFRGTSLLRNILVGIMQEHRSPITQNLRLELMKEMQAHKVTQKRYDFVQGEAVEDLKRDVIQLRRRLEKYEPQLSVNADVDRANQAGLVERIRNIFGK